MNAALDIVGQLPIFGNPMKHLLSRSGLSRKLFFQAVTMKTMLVEMLPNKQPKRKGARSSMPSIVISLCGQNAE